MTSTTLFSQPRPTTRLADRRRFRQSIGGVVGAAMVGVGTAVALSPAVTAVTAD